MIINTSSLVFPIIAAIAILCAVVIAVVFVLRKKNSGSSDNHISATASMAVDASRAAGVSTAGTAAAAVPTHGEAPGSAGEIKLYNVPDKQAAMAMAIIADHLSTPLNQLRFKSIKLVD